MARGAALLAKFWARRTAVGWALIVAAFAAFAALPLTAHRGYMDEKALVVGTMGLTIADVARSAVALAQKIEGNGAAGEDLHGIVARAAALAAAAGDGLPVPPAWANSTSPAGCRAAHGFVRGGRGDGTESLILALPLRPGAAATGLAAAVGLQAARHLTTAPWLAKTLSVVFIEDSPACSALHSLEGWLEGAAAAAAAAAVTPLGLPQQGLVLDVRAVAATEARLGVHGYGGQLPNLDLVVLTKRNLDYFTALPGGVGLDVGGAPARRLFATPPPLPEALSTAAAFAAALASGRPTGAHAALLRRGADALTLALVRPGEEGSVNGRSEKPEEVVSTAKSALAAAEMVVRTCNNLHERLHHASALYLLVDAEYFVAVGAYMAPPGLLLAALLLRAAGATANAAAAPAGRGGWAAAWAAALAVHGVAVAAVAAAVGGAGWSAGDAARAGSGVAAAGLGLWKVCPFWAGQLLGDAEKAPKSAAKPSRAPFWAACSALLVAEAVGLLLWRWALCFACLAIAVPLLYALS